MHATDFLMAQEHRGGGGGEREKERETETDRKRDCYQTHQSLAAERKVSLEVTLMSLTTSPWPVYCCTQSLVSTSQSFTVRSAPPVQDRSYKPNTVTHIQEMALSFSRVILMFLDSLLSDKLAPMYITIDHEYIVFCAKNIS